MDKHADNCDWHLDQYPWECTCGATWRDSKENCPHCGAQLQGDPIPEQSRHLFGATHFSRKIGVYDTYKDRTVEYQCPDCGQRWRS